MSYNKLPKRKWAL